VETRLSTTPFGRRSLTLAHVASQANAKVRPADKAVHRWKMFRAICTAKNRIGVTERALSVLNALLSFHPETVLTGDELVVFPSNQQLCLRAHGMSPATLRRHLAVLVDCGLVIRRDSPNGKRYARKDRAGEIEVAFGFDLSPLVARADEIEAWAEEVELEERALKLVREKISICRRDIAKMIATGIEESVPTRVSGQGPASWMAINESYRGTLSRIPRTATRLVLEPLADELAVLADEITILLENHVKAQNLSGNESHSERHIQNSKPDSPTDLEPRFPESRGAIVEIEIEPSRMPQRTYPLGMVLEACPDIIDYSRTGIGNWRDFVATVSVVRPMLGISPSAWFEAQAAMGDIEASVVIAAILQRGEAINSAGGYLRGLTRRAEAGEFSLGPMLMALISQKTRGKQRA
jgi:replication initiation protein RepC